jgi:hypothetical protein
MQGVGGGPGGVRGRGGVGGGEVADLIGGAGGGAGGVLPDRVPLGRVNGSPGVARAGSQRQRSLGSVRSGASFPPPNHTGVPARVRGGTDRAMPDGAAEAPRPERGVRLLEQPVEPAEVAVTAGEQRRFQFGGVPPSGDEVRIGVLLPPPGPKR